MADFTSGFWSWFIIILTILSIAAMFILNRWMAEPKQRAEEKPKPVGHVWDQDLEELNNPLPRWWLNMFYITLIFSVVYLILYPGLGSFPGLFGWTSTGQYQKELDVAEKRYAPLFEQYLREDLKALTANPEALKAGERLYVTYCTGCHGADARGAPGYPSLRDDDWLYGGSPETIKLSIMKGRSGQMPGWGAVLKQDGVFEVAEYVISLSGKRVVNQDAADKGKEKFMQMCVACHGADGKGDPKIGAPNLSDNIWLYGSAQKTVMDVIEKGRTGNMPAHGEFLGEAKAHVLAAYVYSLSQPPAVK
ncbi:MAG: cytochrome-c oxidase, cbb3-type subunit III [Pseudomonadota bacterium]|nr:MAG: cytochrome-c oxidase, cbb3-type subunit III [Pseudomonadota bacterium]